MTQKPSDADPKPASLKGPKLDKTCSRCGGTGLVCGVVPVIGPKNCCVDYANAFCPDCKGSGVFPE
jgi:hypothetical protein